MSKGVLFILLGLFIDGFQAFMSFALLGIASIPGPIGGCLVGGKVAGDLGCLILGAIGSIPIVNGFFAAATMPIGIAMGIAVSFCLTVTLGIFLVTMMRFSGMLYPKYLIWAGGELIPGINNIPFWTAFTILCVLKKKSEEGQGAFAGAAGFLTGTLSPGSVAGAAIGGVMNLKEQTMRMSMDKNAYDQTLINAQQGKDWLSQAENAENNPKEKEPISKTRSILNDIRPIRTAAAILLAIALTAIGSAPIHAQTLGSQVDPIRFLIGPEVPGPNQLTTMEVQGVGTFLGDANITWQVNGKTVSSGLGQKTFSFTTGDIGVATRIHVIIDSSVQGTIVRDFTFTPTRINLFWEADTSIPPMYRGKALYTAGSALKVVAFPQVVVGNSTVSANNLSFQWKLNDTPATTESGKGHNTFSFQGSQLRDGEQVSVDVYFGSSRVGQASIFIPATDPQVLFYNKDPLRGVLFDQAFPTNVTLVGKEITVQAVPYYFANESLRSGAASFDWTLNGNTTSGPDSANGALTLRQEGSGSGEASLSVKVQNIDPKKFVQAAQAALRIVFGGTDTTGSSAFGL